MKHVFGLVAAVALAGVTLAAAYTDVTFVMKSGERVAGTFSYNHTDHYQLIVSGRQRDWPSSDIALIEFNGGDPTADEVNRLPASADPPELERHTLVLRSGEMIRGKIWDFQGDRIFMDLGPNDRRSWSMNDAARLYISAPGSRALFANANAPAANAPANGRGRNGTVTPPVATPPVVAAPPVGSNRRGRNGTVAPVAPVAPTPPVPTNRRGRTAGNGNTFDLPGTSCWVDTGINVGAGQTLSFEATGVITLSNSNTDTATPAGSALGKPGQGAPLRSSLLGALIGRIDNYQPFGIGNQTQALSMPQTGRLWIGINDGACADNGGSFRVTIR